MISVVNSFIVHVLISFLFSFVYFFMGDSQFAIENKTDLNYSKFLNLAVTTQAGVGLSSVNPKTTFAESILILQQLVKMGTYLVNIFVISFEASVIGKHKK